MRCSNLAYEAVPEPAIDQDEVKVIIEIFSARQDKHVAYQLSHREFDACQHGKLDWNQIVNFMIKRLRDHNGEEA